MFGPKINLFLMLIVALLITIATFSPNWSVVKSKTDPTQDTSWGPMKSKPADALDDDTKNSKCLKNTKKLLIGGMIMIIIAAMLALYDAEVTPLKAGIKSVSSVAMFIGSILIIVSALTWTKKDGVCYPKAAVDVAGDKDTLSIKKGWAWWTVMLGGVIGIMVSASEAASAVGVGGKRRGFSFEF